MISPKIEKKTGTEHKFSRPLALVNGSSQLLHLHAHEDLISIYNWLIAIQLNPTFTPLLLEEKKTWS